jgi:hypothetical protein
MKWFCFSEQFLNMFWICFNKFRDPNPKTNNSEAGWKWPYVDHQLRLHAATYTIRVHHILNRYGEAKETVSAKLHDPAAFPLRYSPGCPLRFRLCGPHGLPELYGEEKNEEESTGNRIPSSPSSSLVTVTTGGLPTVRHWLPEPLLSSTSPTRWMGI